MPSQVVDTLQKADQVPLPVAVTVLKRHHGDLVHDRARHHVSFETGADSWRRIPTLAESRLLDETSNAPNLGGSSISGERRSFLRVPRSQRSWLSH